MDDRAGVFTALYDRHYATVLAYARTCGAWQAAEDIAAETFLVAWRRLPDVPQQAPPWLLGVAANVVRHHRRADGRQGALAERVSALSGPVGLAGSDPAEQVAERLAVQRALARLSERDRDTLTLVAWLDLAPAEAARVVGCSAATFAVRLHRAKRRLRRALRSRDAPAATPGTPGPHPAVGMQPSPEPPPSWMLPAGQWDGADGQAPDAAQQTPLRASALRLLDATARGTRQGADDDDLTS